MADVRRRKRVTSSGNSEDISEGSENEHSQDPEASKAGGPESDYESAEDEEKIGSGLKMSTSVLQEGETEVGLGSDQKAEQKPTEESPKTEAMESGPPELTKNEHSEVELKAEDTKPQQKAEPVSETQPVSPVSETQPVSPEPVSETRAISDEPEPVPETKAVSVEPEPVPETQAVSAEPEPVSETQPVSAEPESEPEPVIKKDLTKQNDVQTELSTNTSDEKAVAECPSEAPEMADLDCAVNAEPLVGDTERSTSVEDSGVQTQSKDVTASKEEHVSEAQTSLEEKPKESSEDTTASCRYPPLTEEPSSERPQSPGTDSLPETLETYPQEEEEEEKLQNIVCDGTGQQVAQLGDASLTLSEVAENVLEVLDLVNDLSLTGEEGTEECESFEAFCGGSTSGDLLDEEGGMEGAAEVEDGDCQFLEEDEEDAREDLEETDDAQEYAEGERQQGDGEESVSPCPSKEKVLDDDEDRRNPQYIPKKGSFYEHDDRAGSDAEEEKEQKDKDKKRTKKLWSDDGRWGHDMFREEEQAPKSREELVQSYGYDIRSEDGPPRARRRRRYGRGPNKYTRNWQDEDAYLKGGHEVERTEAGSRAEMSPRESGRGGPSSRGGSRGMREFRGSRGRRGGRVVYSDFKQSSTGSTNNISTNNNNNNNTGSNNNNNNSTNNKNVDSARNSDVVENEAPALSNSYSTVVNNNNSKNLEPCLTAEEFPALPSMEMPLESATVPETTTEGNQQTAAPASPTETQVFRTLTFENSRFSGKSDVREQPKGRGRNSALASLGQEKRGSYGRGSRRGGNRGGPSPKGFGPSQQTEPEELYNLNAEMEKLKLQEANQASHPAHRKEAYKQRVSAPVQESSVSQKSNEGRPKRYSSLRQRSLQESSNFQAPQTQSQYYEPGYPGSMYSEHLPSTQHQATTPTPVNPLMTSAYPGGYNPAPYQDTFSAALRAPMPNPSRLYHPSGPAQPVVATPYLPPSMGPNGPLLNYAGPPPPPPAGAYPPQFQLLQPYGTPQAAPPTPGVVPQTHELYTGGITYYSPHGQQFVPGGRAMPQKRPKAAIPIVPPPESQVVGNYESLVDSRSHSEGLADPSTNVLEVES